MPSATAGNKWRLSPDQLEALCRTDPTRPRIVILNYPSNPTGCTYSPQKLKEVAEVARKYRVVLISDEIYGRLHHKGRHLSIARYYPEGTIISSGLSKWCGAGGWRLGTFSFPPNLRWLLDAMAIVASETYTATSAPIQYAAIRAFEGGDEIETYLIRSRQVLQAIGQYLVERLQGLHLQVIPPDGAFYLFPDFEHYRSRLRRKGIYTSVELCQRLLDEEGVAVLPGHDFGRPPEELTARLAYVDFDGEAVLEAVAAMQLGEAIDAAFVEKHCFKMVEGLERLERWLKRLGGSE